MPTKPSISFALDDAEDPSLPSQVHHRRKWHGSGHQTRPGDVVQSGEGLVTIPVAQNSRREVHDGEPPLAAPPSADQDEPAFPEGGLEAWLVVAGSFCTMFSVFGLINTAGIFEMWFATHQLATYTPSQISWVFSLYLFLVFFVGIQVGPLFDQYGPRYLVAVGSVLMVTSVALLGFCEKYYQILLSYSVLGGLGGALLNTPAYGCIAHFFNARLAFATGIATAAGGVGGIIFPVVLQSSLPRLGFAWTTRVLGLVLLVLAVPTNLWLRSRAPRQEGRVASVWPDLTIFSDRRYAAATAGIFFMEWGLFVPLTFVVSYAVAHGQTMNQAYTLLSLLNASSTVGRFVPGFLADKIGRFNVTIATIALSAAAVFALWLPAGRSHGMLVAFALVFGFVSGSNLALAAVCLGQLCKPGEYGQFFSTAMMVASFGTLSSVPIGGSMVSAGSGEAGWASLILFSGLSYSAALGCFICARALAVGWDLRTTF